MVLAAGINPASAQQGAAEASFVQAFQSYCVSTGADLDRFEDKVPRPGSVWRDPPRLSDGSRVRLTGTTTLIGNDQHRRIGVQIGERQGAEGLVRTCEAQVAFADKPGILAALAFGEGSTRIALDRGAEVEVTSWTVNVGGVAAVVELRIPTYAGIAGRTLTLAMGW
jgi:hypothetical protein